MSDFKFEIKRGDSFIKQIVAWEDKAANKKLPLAGYSFKSQIRKGQTLVADLSISIIDEINGILEVSSLTSTKSWPTPDDGLSWDIEITTPSGQIISTETIVFKCLKDVTRDE